MGPYCGYEFKYPIGFINPSCDEDEYKTAVNPIEAEWGRSGPGNALTQHSNATLLRY